MPRHPLVHIRIFALLAFGSVAYLGLPVALAAPEGAQPTVGGEVAHASRADAMVSTIESFIAAEDFAAGEKSAVELTDAHPGYVKGWLLLGYCQSRNSDFDASNRSYEKALGLGAEETTILPRKAYNYIRLADYDSARDCYTQILQTHYDHPDVLKQLGYLEGELGNYEEASHYYRKALEQDPNNQEILSALAKIETKLGGNGFVKELLEKSLEIDPNDTEALSRLGLLHIKEKNFEAAVAPLGKLVELEPENVKARRNLGVAYYQLGNKAKACGEFQKVRELGGDIEDLYGPLADCYQSTGKNGDALGVIKEGIDNECQKAWLYCMWGKILEDSKSYDAAAAKFTAAANLNEEPWSGYAKKQISRQAQLKKRAEMISNQQGM